MSTTERDSADREARGPDPMEIEEAASFASRLVAGRYVNLHDPTDHTLRDVWRWRRQGGAVPWPRLVVDAPQPPPPKLPPGRIGATFIGHASWLVQIGGVAVLLDPIWSHRASPIRFLGPYRVRAPGQKLDALPPVELLLVSHNHYDHMDLPTLREVRRRWNPPALTGLGNARHLAKVGIEARELDWWQAAEVAGLRVTYVPAQHFSARTAFDRRLALWGGFVIQASDGVTLYFAADSGWCPHFQEIGRRFPRIDLALLPIGAYAPRWFMRTQHMDPEEAVRAHLALRARRSLGMHFGTFAGLTDEAIDEPAEHLAAAREAMGVAPEDFQVPAFGATYEWPVTA